MISRVLTDNGYAFRSKAFAKACRVLGIKQTFTRPYRPQTNGKAERFIQSALREWAYGIPYHHSTERTAGSSAGLITTTGIVRIKASGRQPRSVSSAQSRNNLLTLHS